MRSPESGTAAVQGGATPAAPVLIARGRVICAGPRPAVMGILNLTPDSFFAGSRYWDNPPAALAAARRMIAAGAALVDVGGASTRPGATPVSTDEELRRVLPVVELLVADGIAVSVDTITLAVAAAALRAGAVMINDVTGLRAGDELARLAARHHAGICLMHMQGEPRTMQQAPAYADVVTEVESFLRGAAAKAVAAGVDPAAICLDPGIGFGKTLEHNLALLRAIPRLAGVAAKEPPVPAATPAPPWASSGYPVLLGLSRKSFLGELLGGAGPELRLAGTLGALVAVAFCGGGGGRDAGTSCSSRDVHGGTSVAAGTGSSLAATDTGPSVGGAAILRVHDVPEAVQALRVAAAITREAP